MKNFYYTFHMNKQCKFNGLDKQEAKNSWDLTLKTTQPPIYIPLPKVKKMHNKK